MDIHHAPFVIVAQARSGSTMLRRALHAHDAICCHGELFMKKKVQGHSIYIPGLHWTEKPDALVGRRDGDFQAFMQSLVFPVRPDLSAIGFKILDEQFFFPANEKRMTDFIAAHPNLSLVFLYRQNAFERYISRLIRRGQVDPGRPKVLSEEEFKAFEAASVDRMNRIYRKFSAHRKIVLSYEALAARTASTISFLYGALGADPAPVVIEESKSVRQDVSKLAENHAALSALEHPVFDFDTDDDPSESLASLDDKPLATRMQDAHELGRRFSR